MPTSDPVSEPAGHERVYAAHIKLDQTTVNIDGKDARLSPGTTATVEIKSGVQRVITYLVSPLLRYKQKSLRER